MIATINRTWFKNKLRAGALLVKVGGIYTDDYAHDAEVGFHKDVDFRPAAPDLFNDWFLSTIKIWGDKDGVIDVCFASCEFYEFKLKEGGAQ